MGASTATPVSPALTAWLLEQAAAGCGPVELLRAMRASGWDEASARLALAQTLPGLPAPMATVAAPAGPAPVVSPGATQIELGEQVVQLQFSLALPRVVSLAGFLSDAECDELMALAGPRLSRSETVVGETGGSEVNGARTSDGMFFARAENPLCLRIEQRIADLLHWPVSHGEGLQVLRYRPGAQYLPHHDYFDPAQPGSASVLARGGQRVGTLLIYLNTPEAGGATLFPDVGLEVMPRKGHALFFSYPQPEAATLTLHGGAPVIRGEKWVATKWLREREFS
ncbi:2OG-Fe(II) oxygenase [Ideonella sp.]|uniref:2OG-Fe(II) oxygenase n=1 Tax=Ideonella sp. TaxID=1929293 RepID=UPI003BB7E054